MKPIYSKNPIMVLGTTSGAGKSLISAAICRVLTRHRECPLPFKGQNMSNNAWVDLNGGEMAYSQAFQAWASYLEPQCCMNPVLLKPKGDQTSEVIHLGKSVGIAKAESYYNEWFLSGWKSIRIGLNELLKNNINGRLVLEGAGSPVEVNLLKRDLTNLRLAQYLKANCLLVADIERGGVFAQVIGTLSLMSPSQRKLVKAIIINRFRGRRELFDEGRIWLENKTGIPVIGVLPWIDELFPPEDSLDLINRSNKTSTAEVEISVIRLPSVSNFSDIDPLESEPSVRIKWITLNDSLGKTDAVLLPGSKQTLSDMAKLRESSIYPQLKEYISNGGIVFGLCGGFQMLGVSLFDPNSLESSSTTDSLLKGLSLIPLKTTFSRNKLLKQRTSKSLWPSISTVTGFELHHGLSTFNSTNKNVKPIFEDPQLGLYHEKSNGSFIGGTYLHGIFDNGLWRRSWLNKIRRKKGLPLLSSTNLNFSRQRDDLINLLADVFDHHVDFSPLVKYD